VVGHLKSLRQKVVTVHSGKQFSRIDDDTFVLDPHERAGYELLIRELTARGQTIERIVHLWSLTAEASGRASRNTFEQAQHLGFYSLLYLTQALGAHYVGDRLHLIVASNNLHDVTGEEELQPEKATILGLCKVVPQEYANITCRGIDFSLASPIKTLPPHLLEQFTEDLDSPPSNELVAYRARHRWEQNFETLRLEDAGNKPPKLRSGGVYLIVGGLGRIGLTLAAYLARNFNARLVLTSRTGLPDRVAWDDWLTTHDEQDQVHTRIVKVRELEGLGAEVLVCEADAANEEQMEAVISAAHQSFGLLDGVIYSAGIVCKKLFLAIPDTVPTECDWHFSSKAHGLYVLERVVREERLDFCMLYSSLSSVLGGLGFAAYASANIFMDVFAQRHNRTEEVPWLSCNWDTW
jgi:acyl transferase domain-containing protein